MKKFLLIFILTLIMITTRVEAKTIKAIALEDFSSQKPPQEYSIQLINREEFKDGIVLESKTVLCGQVIKIQEARRGKRNSFFTFAPTSAKYQNKEINVTGLIPEADIAEYKPINKKETAVYVAKKATNLVFIGASTAISFTEGAAKADNGTRLKSGINSAYKDSPLSYIEVGRDLDITKGDILILKIKE